MYDVAVIADIDEAFEAVEEGVVVVVEVAVVDDECIEIIAGFEAAYVSEETSGRLGGQPEGFGKREER